MRTFIIFIVISIVLSILRRRQGAGTGPPVARPTGFEPVPAPKLPPVTKSPMTPKRPTTSRKTASAGTDAKRLSERMEQDRTQRQRRIEAETSNAAAEDAFGKRTSTPGGIDPRLLDKDRTPQPTPTPIEPR